MPSVEEITAALMEPFPKEALKSRANNGGRGQLTYVDGTTVFRRLIKATDNNFEVQVLNQDFRDFGKTSKGETRLLLIAQVRLTIPGMGSREHVGVQVVNSASGGEDLWKGAVTDGIKKAATLFGVGLELYGPDYESDDYDPGVPAPAAAPQRGPAGGRTIQRPADTSSPQRSVPAPAETGALRVQESPARGRPIARPPVGVVSPPAQQGEPPLAPTAPPQGRVIRRPGAQAAQGSADPLTPASDAQKNYIKGLAKNLGYTTEDGHTDMHQVETFLQGAYQTTWETLTMEEAKSAIEDLKSASEVGAEQF